MVVLVHHCYLVQRYGKFISFFWLVVSNPLKNIMQLGWLFPIYGKMKNVRNHHPVLFFFSPPCTQLSFTIFHLFPVPRSWDLGHCPASFRSNNKHLSACWGLPRKLTIGRGWWGRWWGVPSGPSGYVKIANWKITIECVDVSWCFHWKS